MHIIDQDRGESIPPCPLQIHRYDVMLRLSEKADLVW